MTKIWRHARIRVDLIGVVGDRRMMIRESSLSGALLVCDTTAPLANDFTMYVPSERSHWSCEIVHRNGLLVAVRVTARRLKEHSA